MSGNKKVFGRNDCIEQLWRALQKQSVIFTAERRIGKTTVLQAMHKKPFGDNLVIYSDLEKIATPEQFVENILFELSANLPSSNKALNWFDKVLPKLGGTKVAGVLTLPEIKQRHWQPLLEETIETVCTAQGLQQFVFLWDELPYMLQNIHQSEEKSGTTQNSALQLLDTLRALRHKHPNLRMIYTGSIGLHHVLNQLRGDKLASQPLNDMWQIELHPIAQTDAADFCRHLLVNNGINTNESESVIETIIEQTDSVPFYIERLVDLLTIQYSERLEKVDVDDMLLKLLTDGNDVWQMEHFRERLNIYYPGEIDITDGSQVTRKAVVKMILNHMAVNTEAASIEQCFAAIRVQIALTDRDEIVELMGLLVKDHYLMRDSSGKYTFRFGLLKRWWILAEGLSHE